VRTLQVGIGKMLTIVGKTKKSKTNIYSLEGGGTKSREDGIRGKEGCKGIILTPAGKRPPNRN